MAWWVRLLLSHNESLDVSVNVINLDVGRCSVCVLKRITEVVQLNLEHRQVLPALSIVVFGFYSALSNLLASCSSVSSVCLTSSSQCSIKRHAYWSRSFGVKVQVEARPSESYKALVTDRIPRLVSGLSFGVIVYREASSSTSLFMPRARSNGNLLSIACCLTEGSSSGIFSRI